MGWLVRIIVIYAVVNVALWGGQELLYREDTHRIDQLKSELQVADVNISNLSARIDAKKGRLAEIQAQLDNLKRKRAFSQYNSIVNDYNDLVRTYDSDIDTYKSSVADYNLKVKETNNLIDKSGKRWYLIPIPLPSASVKARPASIR